MESKSTPDESGTGKTLKIKIDTETPYPELRSARGGHKYQGVLTQAMKLEEGDHFAVVFESVEDRVRYTPSIRSMLVRHFPAGNDKMSFTTTIGEESGSRTLWIKRVK
jgi:hypothetical protein